MKKIPFHIISGFLGSGKTTFLKHIIDQYSSEKKIGIIQNEFAPANIDGAVLKQSGKDFNLLEINNGSVFCVCLLGDFVKSLDKFVDEYQPDDIIIEASGLSDTTSISEIIAASSLADKIYLASNWCIVDAPNFAKVGFMKQRVSHQLRMADIVVINKTDLVDTGIAEVRDEIKKINPFAEIRETTFCNIDFELGNSPISKFYFSEVEAMKEPKINSMVLKSARKTSCQSLEIFLNEWAPKSYRIKGFVNLTNGKIAAVQCTFETIEIIEMENTFRPTEIIAISDQFTMREWNKSFKELV